MATGGVDPDVDHRKTCSICLEPFRGRRPKLLPCFHTFCLPCLRQLTCDYTLHQSQDTAETGAERPEGETRPRSTLICPSCRAVTSLPAGGVAYLQTNFYLDNADEEESLPAPVCDVCDGEQTAEYSCTKCPKNVCSTCRRYHDKFCLATGLVEIMHKQTKEGDSSKREQQIQLVEKVLKVLSSKKTKLAQESESIEGMITEKRATVLRLLDEAQYASVKSVRASAAQMAAALERETNEADEKLRKLRRRSSWQSENFPQDQSDLLNEAEAQHFQELLSQADREILMNYKLDNGKLMNSVKEFVGAVAQPSFQPGLTRSTDTSRMSLVDSQKMPAQHVAEHDHACSQGTVETLEAAAKFDQLSKDFAECKKLVTALQTDNAALRKEVAAAVTKNTSLCASIAALEKNSVSLEEMSREFAECKKRMSGLQDDMQKGMATNTNLHASVTTMGKEVEAFKETSTSTKGELSALEKSLTTQVSALQTDVGRLSKDVVSLSSLQTNLTNQVSALQRDVGSLSQDAVSGKADIGQLMIDKESLNQSVSSLQSHLFGLQNSVASSNTTLCSLEYKLAKSCTLVAFHAILGSTVTLENDLTYQLPILVCGQIVTNVGNGYNNATGIFTAPVTGTYCFMVTTSPNDPDLGIKAKLDVMHESKLIGYVTSAGRRLVTGHTVAQVNAGEQVWLQSHGYDEHTFAGGWRTTFSGMLLQVEL